MTQMAIVHLCPIPTAAVGPMVVAAKTVAAVEVAAVAVAAVAVAVVAANGRIQWQPLASSISFG